MGIEFDFAEGLVSLVVRTNLSLMFALSGEYGEAVGADGVLAEEAIGLCFDWMEPVLAP